MTDTRVLIVDDDADLRRTIRTTLQMEGYDTVCAPNAEEARRVLDEEPVPVMVTDLRMPGEGGMSLFVHPRVASGETHAVLMSGFATVQDFRKALSAGAVEVLCKPFTTTELIEAVKKALECATGFRGTVHGLSLVDIMQMFHLAHRDVVIGVAGPCSGEIHVRAGEIVHATCGDEVGEVALRALLGQSGGNISTRALEPGGAVSITGPFDSVLLDNLRTMDETRDVEPLAEDSDLFMSFMDDDEFKQYKSESPKTAQEGATNMGKIDDACKDVVGNVDGAVSCGVIDLSTGMILGIYNNAQYTQTLNEVVAAATLDMFRGANVTRIEKMVRSHRGVPEDGEHYFEEVHVSSRNNYHFAKTIKSGKAAIVLVTKKTTNIGMGWAQLKSVIPDVEPHVP